MYYFVKMFINESIHKIMAQQLGNGYLKGRIDDIIYYQKNGKHFAMRKRDTNRNQVLYGENYVRARENMAEFGLAAKHGKGIRRSLNRHLHCLGWKGINELTSTLLRVIKSDPSGERGKRTLYLQNLPSALEGWNFNKKASWEAMTPLVATPVLDRVSGWHTVVIDAHYPLSDILAPGGATHYNMTCGIISLSDNKPMGWDGVFEESDRMPLTVAQTPETTVKVFTKVIDASMVLMFVCGVQFFRLSGGLYYPLGYGKFNSQRIFLVSVA